MRYLPKNKRRATVAGLTSALVLCLVFVLPACDGLLEETPQSSISTTNYYRNQQDALDALSAAYGTLQHVRGPVEGNRYIFMMWYATEMVTTNARPQSSEGAFDVYDFTPGNSYLPHAWENSYAGINAANAVIDNVPGIEMDETLKARVVAEARFLRSLYYFYLVRLFGGVPLRTQETTALQGLELPRASADSVYNFIINDLKEAINALPPKSSYTGMDKARVSQGAAKTLQAKAYLQRGAGGTVTATPQPDDFQNAARVLKEIIDSGEYGLVADYGSLWDWTENNQANEETIFSVEHQAGAGQNSRIQNFLAPPNSNFGARQWQHAHGEVPFYTSYQDEDVRQEATWISEYVDPDGEVRTLDVDDPANDGFERDGPALNKHIMQQDEFPPERIDYLLLRYADVLLMYAEALNEINGGPTAPAYDAINQVRNRAGLPDLEPGLGYEGFKDALFQEGRWELATEGHGWFSGQRFFERFRRALEASADNAQPGDDRYPQVDFELEVPKDRLFPIPQSALDRNPQLTQNPGYAGGQ